MLNVPKSPLERNKKNNDGNLIRGMKERRFLRGRSTIQVSSRLQGVRTKKERICKKKQLHLTAGPAAFIKKGG